MPALVITPRVSRKVLTENSLMGWGTRIAILDSGIPHDITATEEKDFTGTGLVDRKGHGTRVVHIVKHFAGGAQLIIGKVGDGFPKEAALIKGLEWAVDRGAKIINISSGYGTRKGCRGTCTLGRLINKIVKDTLCIITVAAGNDGPDENTINCPACASNAVTVGSIDPFGKLATYSSRGRAGFLKPNILAPGMITLGFNSDRGTSYSTPIITGILGAVLNKFNTPQDAIEALYGTADPLDGVHAHQQGSGVLNLERLCEVISNGRGHSGDQGQKESS
jgi:subtilisin family serine protease